MDTDSQNRCINNPEEIDKQMNRGRRRSFLHRRLHDLARKSMRESVATSEDCDVVFSIDDKEELEQLVLGELQVRIYFLFFLHICLYLVHHY